MRVPVIPMRYGTDLGQLSADCLASSHGTYTAYRRGCRCPHAREAHRVYAKRQREGRGAHHLVDACGVRRRIQALWAVGHTSQVISDATGGRFSADYVFALIRRSFVTVPTYTTICAVYRDLAGRPGVSARTRARAAAAGYASPVQWGADIDDPAAVPDSAEPEPFDATVVDEVLVERALAGERLPLNDDELEAALRIGTARGEALSAVSSRLGMNHMAAKRLLKGELSPGKARQAAVAEALRVDPDRTNTAIAAEFGVGRDMVRRVRQQIVKNNQIAS